VGFTADDVDALAEGTRRQHRVTKLWPRPADKEQMKQIFLDSLVIW
jgi:alcohol dehydrogenase class IV